jgi:hypothetical protein
MNPNPSEERFFNLLTHAKDLPDWFKGVIEPSDLEDVRFGIDFYVLLEGEKKIPVEIKSSARGLKNYVTKRGSKDVCVIIIREKLSDPDNLKNILIRLEEWKSRHLS